MQASLERLRRRREELGDEGGFTLIELLIVIVILGILAAIVVFAVQNLTGSSVQASCRSDFKTVESALETYKAQLGAYPTGATSGAVQTDFSPSQNSTPKGASDVDLQTAGFTPASAALATPAANAVNVAAAVTAGNGGELLTGSYFKTVGGAFQDQNGNATNNLTASGWTAANPTGVGPWLKDVPKNSGHYSIWANNDGSGQIYVLNGDGKLANDPSGGPIDNNANTCSSVH